MELRAQEWVPIMRILPELVRIILLKLFSTLIVLS
jgi:hypothetical protein